MDTIRHIDLKRLLCFGTLMLTFGFGAAAKGNDWNRLIGKTLVLYRYGTMKDGWFEKSFYPNPAGESPMEQIVLSDSTHLFWQYSMQGNFERRCSLNDSVLHLNTPLFGNSHLRITSHDAEVVLTEGDDNLTRIFFIQNTKPTLPVLPESIGSRSGFCDGKVNNLLPFISDLTYHSSNPMGRHFLHYKQITEQEKLWFESKKDGMEKAGMEVKAYDIELYPHGKPVLADVNQKRLNDCNAVSVLASMAYHYPEFIRSIIHKESKDSFIVDMFDPEGKPIRVCVSNLFPTQDGFLIFCAGKDYQPNWVSILEKAAMKYIAVYRHINSIEGCNAEMITPMFTGDGRSFSVQPGRLKGDDLAHIINTCLEYGMMVNGGFLKTDIPLDAHKTIAKHGHSFLPPQRTGAIYAIRNPWGNGKDNHIMNVMSSDSIIFPLIDIRIISPGAAARYFHRNKVGMTGGEHIPKN